eukprot:9476394-Pyramimonas_sp.AAC.1
MGWGILRTHQPVSSYSTTALSNRLPTYIQPYTKPNVVTSEESTSLRDEETMFKLGNIAREE